MWLMANKMNEMKKITKKSPTSSASRGPLAHTFTLQNRSFSEVKNLATSRLIICHRHALRTCGSAVTQRFIPYCQLSSRRFKLSLRNM